jgi:glycosyltransferase involved in cell wall biosynthesis
MQPTVSIIVPCFNEEATIGSLLDAIHKQTYPRDRLEVVIADGLSEDGTRAAVDRFQQKHAALAVRVIDNPKRTIPAGLNQAIRKARGEILVRLDAHSAPIPEYVERCVRALSWARGQCGGGGTRSRGRLDRRKDRGSGHPGQATPASAGRRGRAVDTCLWRISADACRRRWEFDEACSRMGLQFNVQIESMAGGMDGPGVRAPTWQGRR